MEYLISDLHFGDAAIIKYEKRPFSSVEEMDAALIQRWNKTVTDKDIVYVLGDVGVYGKPEMQRIVKQLKGEKVLIMGNHDDARSEEYWRDVGFNRAYKVEGILIHKWLWLCHKPPEYTQSDMPWRIAYGHVHTAEVYNTITKHTVCVCAERWNYTPVSLEYLMGCWRSF